MVIKVGEVYPSNNCGDMEVIEYVNYERVRVKFLDTGHEKYAYAHHIHSGTVKDPLKPSVYGVGYMGEGLYKSRTKGGNTKAYYTWHNMFKRCYEPTYLERNHTYIGCSVVKEWHNFQVFSVWFDNNYKIGLDLDKDIKVPGNKVYGPDTCMFVTTAENIEVAHAKTTIFRSPEGERVEVHNTSAFARDNGLNQGNLSAVKNGKRNHHKGWTLYKD